jgi:membrane fusion protein (multidrug efflux system)
MVPTESIVPILKGQQVYVYRNGKAEAVKVDTGIRNDTAIEITKGLKEQDTVITSGLMQIRPGMEVRLLSVK